MAFAAGYGGNDGAVIPVILAEIGIVALAQKTPINPKRHYRQYKAIKAVLKSFEKNVVFSKYETFELATSLRQVLNWQK